MRVLAMLHAYVPHHNAGAEVMAHALLRELVHAGHDVDVLLSRVEPASDHLPYTIDGVRVHPHRGKSDPFAFLGRPSRAPHVIVAHLENLPRACVLGRMYRRPVVDLVHNTMSETRAHIERGPVALAVFNSHWMRDDFADYWEEFGRGALPRHIVVRPPVDPRDYRVTPGECVTLVNLTEQKGAPLFYRLAEQFPDTPFLAVPGAYGRQIIRDGLPNVEVVEHVPAADMPKRVYARTRVLLVPSVYESYGRVAAEAICSGIPVIAHPTPGLRECLGPAGIYADRDDLDAWAAALRRLGTARGWSAASKRAAKRAAGLDPAEDLARWVEAVQEVSRRGIAAAGRG